MKKDKKNVSFPSELRYDLVGQDWVVVATGRAKRPEMFKKEGKKREMGSTKNCPFCKIETQKKPVLIFAEGKMVKGNEIPGNWTTAVIPNKYPAFLPYESLNIREEGGLYRKMNAVGFHEVVVLRDHKLSLAGLSLSRIKELFDVYQQRFLSLKEKRFVNHIAIFHNYGPESGASVAHPHSQVITTPLIDIDLRKALDKSLAFWKKKKQCAYCQMNAWELKIRERIVFENDSFLAICPFASKSAFQTIISPKKHLSYFERITEKEKVDLAEAFQVVFRKIDKGLSDPDYNFYLHTSPCDGKEYPAYHWHWTILPKTAISAGFEIGTRMEISIIEPEKAAAYLRKQ